MFLRITYMQCICINYITLVLCLCSDDRVSIIQVQQIQDKCVIMKLDDKVVVSHLPNSKDED